MTRFRCGHPKIPDNLSPHGDGFRCLRCKKHYSETHRQSLTHFHRCGHERTPENMVPYGKRFRCRMCYESQGERLIPIAACLLQQHWTVNASCEVADD